MKQFGFGLILAGLSAGAVNGLFGAGGGMVLIPLMAVCAKTMDRELFSGCVAIIFPMCIISLITTELTGQIYWKEALPYLPGSAFGGYLAVRCGNRIPVSWLHRGLGILMLWGGIRYLC